jgi:uroporphyrinogen-III synthase
VTAPPRVLEGLTIGVTADRRAAEQGKLLEQRGARVVHGPSLETATIDDHEAARAATEALVAMPPDIVIANTAIGIRTWLALADAWGLTEEIIDVLGAAYVVARGPKAAGALLAVGVEVEWRPSSAVLADLIRHLLTEHGVAGRR